MLNCSGRQDAGGLIFSWFKTNKHYTNSTETSCWLLSPAVSLKFPTCRQEETLNPPFLGVSSQFLNGDYICQELISTYCRRRSDGEWHRCLWRRPERNRRGGQCRLEGAARPCSLSTFLCRTVQTFAEYMESLLFSSLYAVSLSSRVWELHSCEVQALLWACWRWCGLGTRICDLTTGQGASAGRPPCVQTAASQLCEEKGALGGGFYRQARGLLHWFWGIIGEAG